uniref:Uncharacterized protein n=1 Tax=Canis lupus familiaris TaxID=9615 RepID=A0A8C0NTB0_CANLF
MKRLNPSEVPTRDILLGICELWFFLSPCPIEDTTYFLKLYFSHHGTTFSQRMSLSRLVHLSVLGTPNEDTWPGVHSLPHFKPERFTLYSSKNLRQAWNKLSYVNYAEDLASKLLQCSPKNRLSAQAALSHEYFSDLPPRLWELTDSEYDRSETPSQSKQIILASVCNILAEGFMFLYVHT